jgi:beta-galactosidase beta subunit
MNPFSSISGTLVFLIVTSCLVAASSQDLVKTKVSDRVTVSLPADFFPMTPEDITQRMPSVRAPLGAYTNQDRVVDFSVNISATQWPDGNQEMAAKFFKAALYNLYDKVVVISEGTHTIKKKNYIYFEFESRTNASQRLEGMSEPILKYTYIQYLVEPKQTLVFSFNCPRTVREDWQETARAMMKSVRVK